MAFTIIWSTQALQDLQSLTHFIAMDNPQAAEKLGLSILEKTDLLIKHPQLGRVTPERNDPKIRELVQSPFRIIYRITARENKIEVMRIWHASRGEPQF